MQKSHFESRDYMKHPMKQAKVAGKIQSSVALSRESGVSYIKESESMQKGVPGSYQKLDHIIYQGSYSVRPL